MRRQTVLLSLGSICAALALALLYLIFAPLPELEPPSVPLAHKPRPVLDAQPIAMPPPAVFAEIDARPAFRPDRKPVAAPQTAAASVAPPDVRVVGVIIDGENRIAMIRVPSSPLATAFHVGGAISGWQIAEIDPDRVVLSSGGVRDEIRLDANKAPKAVGTRDSP